jgi:WD40 repeat protein
LLPETVVSARLSVDGTVAFGGESSGTILKFDLTGSKPAGQSIGGKGREGKEGRETVAAFGDIATDRCGKRLAWTSGDGRVVVWDLAEDKECIAWAFGRAPNRIAFTHDGRHLLTLNDNGTVYVLELPCRGDRP